MKAHKIYLNFKFQNNICDLGRIFQLQICMQRPGVAKIISKILRYVDFLFEKNEDTIFSKHIKCEGIRCNLAPIIKSCLEAHI